jgi:flagellar secretion chaperone FliS
MNPYANAKQAYTESSVMTAPPERLVVMLYDGAIRFLSQAAVATRTGNLSVCSDRLRRAEAIIDELNVSLDMQQGDVAQQLRSIYLFSKRHLAGARLERDADAIDDVSRLLGELREAWQQLAENAASTRPAAV